MCACSRPRSFPPRPFPLPFLSFLQPRPSPLTPVPEWATMWGAKVKMPVDVPDDMLKDALETSSRVIDQYPDFENDGECSGGLVLGLGAGAVSALTSPRLTLLPPVFLQG